MTEREDSEATEGEQRRFNVALFIVHPTLDPAEITAALGIQPTHVHCVGDRRITPNGTLLPGTYPDTRWRRSLRHEVSDQWFAGQVGDFVESLLPFRPFLSELRSTGGRASLVIQFLGDGYFGDELPWDVLGSLRDLELDLGIECFVVPQRP